MIETFLSELKLYENTVTVHSIVTVFEPHLFFMNFADNFRKCFHVGQASGRANLSVVYRLQK